VEIKGRFSVTSENVDLAKVQEIPGSSASRKLQEVRIFLGPLFIRHCYFALDISIFSGAFTEKISQCW